VLQLFEHTIAASTREAAAVRVRVAFFEIAGKRCFDLLHHTRREIFLKDSEDGYVILQVWNPSGRGPRATLCGTGVLPFTNTSGLLGSLLWFRPGLCQCRFRIAQFSPLVPPKLRQYRSKPAAQLLPIRPVTKLRFVCCVCVFRRVQRSRTWRAPTSCWPLSTRPRGGAPRMPRTSTLRRHAATPSCGSPWCARRATRATHTRHAPLAA
jgi:hypothetical protein